MARKHFKCKGFHFPNPSDADLLGIWETVHLHIQATKYEYDKIIVELSALYDELSFLLGAPNDLDLQATPFSIDLKISGIEKEARSISESQTDAFYLRIRKWSRLNLRRSWEHPSTKRLFRTMKHPHRKLGVYTTDDLHYVRPAHLEWLCGSRIDFQKQDFRFALERFAFRIGIMNPQHVFWCEDGRIKNIFIYRDELIGEGIDEIDDDFLREFDKVAAFLCNARLVPNAVYIDSQIEYEKHSAQRISAALGGVPVKRMTAARKDKFFNDLEQKQVRDENWFETQWESLINAQRKN